MTARRARRDMARGRVESALKVLSGSQEGLPATYWRHGIANLDRCSIQFRRRLWQLCVPRPFAPVVRIDVVSLRVLEETPRLREMWSISPGLSLAEVTTPTATLVWAVPPIYADWAWSRVRTDEG